MKEIGNQLREAREKKKLSVQDVSIATKINNKIIKAIEDGDLNSLPAKPFLRGFIQTYARYLEINVDGIMKQFFDLQGSTKPKPQITEDAGSAQDNHEEVQNKFEMYKKVAYSVAAVVAVFFIYFIQKVVSKYEQESKVALEQKEVVKQIVEPLPETPVVASTTPESTETPAATPASETPAPAAVPPVEVKTEEVKPVVAKPAEVKPLETKPVEVKPAPTTPLVTAPAAPPKPATPTPAPAAVVPPVTPPVVKVEEKKIEEKKPEEKKTSRPQQIIIEALDNVEIRYSKDGESDRTVKLKPEQFLTIKASEKINLSVSDSGAVNIIHNGRDKGVPGNLGQPTKINYP